MDPRNRVLRLLTADIARLIHEAPNPQACLEQLVLDWEGAIVELRREAVAGLVRQKRLEQELAEETQTPAARRELEAAAACERRRVLELLQVQVLVEDRARALRCATESLASHATVVTRPGGQALTLH